MNKYYLIKTDTNDKIDTELYLDKLSKGYVELTEEDIKGLIADEWWSEGGQRKTKLQKKLEKVLKYGVVYVKKYKNYTLFKR